MNAVIAIVDDDQSVRDAVASLMSSHGCTVTVFASAEDFISSAPHSAVECLIADVNMPGMTGLELYEVLFSRGEQVPTIFITAFANERDRRHALNLGKCYLTKPFSEDELLGCVCEALDQS